MKKLNNAKKTMIQFFRFIKIFFMIRFSTDGRNYHEFKNLFNAIMTAKKYIK